MKMLPMYVPTPTSLSRSWAKQMYPERNRRLARMKNLEIVTYDPPLGGHLDISDYRDDNTWLILLSTSSR